jgi:hypothetical protein
LIIFIDGHGNPYHTKKYAVSGRMSVTEKIMPGTHHVVANTQNGFLLFLYPEPANTHLNDGLENVVKILIEEFGDKIRLVVVDRECNGADYNMRIKDQYGVSILTGLRSNQYSSLDDFEYKWVEKHKLAVGMWKDKIKCKNDDRNFLLYPQKNKLYALAITSDREQDFIDAYKLQKMRWPSNEGVIKILVNEFDFNMNTGNGTKIIDNPKIQNIQQESDKKAKGIVTAFSHDGKTILWSEEIMNCNELEAVHKSLKEINLKDKIITADALSTQKSICSFIDKQDGYYLRNPAK